MTNADLAGGAARVLVLRPSAADATDPFGNLRDEIAVLEATSPGLRSAVISADPASIDAFGTNPLSPTTRASAARAGRACGAREAIAVARLLGFPVA